MNLPQPSHRPAGVTSSPGIVRLIRRICVLREQGDAAAAARLEENDYATAVRDRRLAEGPDALPAEELQAIFADEERRVADAAVLAELLMPRLAGTFASVISPESRPVAGTGSNREPPVSRSAEPVAGSLAIPDLLDAMLAADRRQSAGRRAER